MSARPPTLLFAGGPTTKKATYAAPLRQAFAATGKPKPRIAYLAAASGDDPRFFQYMRAFLDSGGPCEVELAPLAGKKVSPAKARKVVESADLVFVGGGDVEEGMKWLAHHELIGWLEQRHAQGQAFLGVSAGAIMLCRQWVRWRDPDDDASAEPLGCMGIANALCDTHGEEDDWAELRTLLKLKGEGAVGHGIRTGAAIRVGVDGRIETLVGEVDSLACRGGRAVSASR